MHPKRLDKKLTNGGAFCMGKYSDEQKLEVVLEVEEKHLSYNEAGKKIGA